MAEQMSEEQILDSFVKNSPGFSEDVPAPQQAQEQPVRTPDAPAASQNEPQANNGTTEEPVAAQQEEQDAQTIEIDPEEPLFEQELDDDGKKVTQKLSLKELQQGYLRAKDYTRKTQELARQREEVPQVLAKQAQELSESYGKRLSELTALVMQTVAPELNGVDLNKLANEDAFEYVRLSNRVNQVQQLLQRVKVEQEQEKSRLAEEENKAKAQRWSQSLEVLNRDIPGFGPDVVKRLFDAGKELGFDQAEIAQWDDHRLIKLLYNFSEKKSLESKRPEVERKVALVTKIVKPGTKQANRSSIDEARSRLRKSGKAEDALPIFEQMIR